MSVDLSKYGQEIKAACSEVVSDDDSDDHDSDNDDDDDYAG